MKKLELNNCIEEYGTALYSFCRTITCDKEETDDLYQDTFLTAMEMIDIILLL